MRHAKCDGTIPKEVFQKCFGSRINGGSSWPILNEIRVSILLGNLYIFFGWKSDTVPTGHVYHIKLTLHVLILIDYLCAMSYLLILKLCYMIYFDLFLNRLDRHFRYKKTDEPSRRQKAQCTGDVSKLTRQIAFKASPCFRWRKDQGNIHVFIIFIFFFLICQISSFIHHHNKCTKCIFFHMTKLPFHTSIWWTLPSS